MRSAAHLYNVDSNIHQTADSRASIESVSGEKEVDVNIRSTTWLGGAHGWRVLNQQLPSLGCRPRDINKAFLLSNTPPLLRILYS